ncbi:hypothetical protein X474_01320 [Dethiosulfatarculus sandiegensis]|uniref:Uncharacterized protein n=1 Tax=Dethiosulfatarculus sandiegensis TaxID=1429043 RepID=A0A0D2I0U8_9BACT|nr:hypothetical protein X474_01320 [Dethiosulfatarculus sandiegensis]
MPFLKNHRSQACKSVNNMFENNCCPSRLISWGHPLIKEACLPKIRIHENLSSKITEPLPKKYFKPLN